MINIDCCRYKISATECSFKHWRHWCRYCHLMFKERTLYPYGLVHHCVTWSRGLEAWLLCVCINSVIILSIQMQRGHTTIIYARQAMLSQCTQHHRHCFMLFIMIIFSQLYRHLVSVTRRELSRKTLVLLQLSLLGNKIEQTVNYCVKRVYLSSCVYLSALDASKNFGRVDRSTRFKKLPARDSLQCYIIMNLYSKLNAVVRWGCVGSQWRIQDF